MKENKNAVVVQYVFDNLLIVFLNLKPQENDKLGRKTFMY